MILLYHIYRVYLQGFFYLTAINMNSIISELEAKWARRQAKSSHGGRRQQEIQNLQHDELHHRHRRAPSLADGNIHVAFSSLFGRRSFR